MGNQVSLVPKVSYEDIQMVVYRNQHAAYSSLIINTLPEKMQHCLIKTTVDFRHEEQIINECLSANPNIMIIVYGKNSNDITILHKYEQLTKLGFVNVYIYTGGLFEWLLLHEIYGKELFKITKYDRDHLKYRPKSVLLQSMSQGGGGGIGFGASHAGASFGMIGIGNMPFFDENANHSRHHNRPPDIAIDIPANHNSGGGRGSDSDSDSGSRGSRGSESDEETGGGGGGGGGRNKKGKESSSIFSTFNWLFS
jgi:hypothetical protein